MDGPVLRYYGAKWGQSEWIQSHFPNHIHYVEPCGGSGAVLTTKRRSKIETYNDLDEEVVTFFRVLRDKPAQLVYAISHTPWSRQEFELASTHDPTVSDLETARRFWVRQAFSFGAGPANPGKGMRVNIHDVKSEPFKDLIRLRSRLLDVSKRWRSVQIESADMYNIFDRYDGETTLFYIDPPYVSDTRNKSNQYKFEWSDEDHGIFLDRVKGLKGFVVISGYRNEMYDDALLIDEWASIDQEFTGQSGSRRVETLYLCPKTAQEVITSSLF